MSDPAKAFNRKETKQNARHTHTHTHRRNIVALIRRLVRRLRREVVTCCCDVCVCGCVCVCVCVFSPSLNVEPISRDWQLLTGTRPNNQSLTLRPASIIRPIRLDGGRSERLWNDEPQCRQKPTLHLPVERVLILRASSGPRPHRSRTAGGGGVGFECVAEKSHPPPL